MARGRVDIPICTIGKKIGWVGIIASLLLICCCQPTAPTLPPEGLLQEGDLVFRRGTSRESKSILWSKQEEKYSHIGILVRQNHTFMVVHCVPDKKTNDSIQMEYLADFFSTKNAEAGAILRYADEEKDPTMAAEYALSKYKEGILFDHDYDLSDTVKMYCTELIWNAYFRIDIDITEGRRSKYKNIPLYSGTYIFPIDIYKNQHLVTIYKFNN